MRVWTSWESIHQSRFKLKSRTNHQFITVVVVGRNEEDSIEDCMRSIANNNYPQDKFEIIFVDDHSEDHTIQKLEALDLTQVNILKLSEYPKLGKTQSFKKSGVQYALTKAKGEIIACTDADCIVDSNWLAYIDFGMQQALIKMLIMPIRFIFQKSIIHRFQSLDLMATMAFAGYGYQSRRYYSANGANLAFRKSIYNQINIHEEYASGDDMFLAEEVSKQFPEGIKFLKSDDILVSARAEPSWGGLYDQRKRWATKAKGYRTNDLYKTQRLIFLYNAIIVLNFGLGLTITSLFLFIALIQLLIKGIMDYLLLTNMSDYFKQRKALKLFIISFLVFTPYIILMGMFAVFGKSYLWKGRTVR